MAINPGLFTSKTEEWATPRHFFAELDAEFHFTLDPCATAENHTATLFYTKEDNGLAQNWGGQRVFCNPPYGRSIKDWVRKCSEEARKPGTLVVLLIPARTDTSYFHDYIYHKATEVRFIRGRLHFNEAGPAPFPSMVVIFDNLHKTQRNWHKTQ